MPLSSGSRANAAAAAAAAVACGDQGEAATVSIPSPPSPMPAPLCGESATSPDVAFSHSGGSRIYGTASERSRGTNNNQVTFSGGMGANFRRWPSTMQDMAQDVLTDILTPLPRSVSIVMRTFKDLTQSVVEVMRIESVQVSIPAGVPAESYSLEVSVFSPGRRLCRNRRPKVYGKFVIPLDSVSRDTLSCEAVNCDCRVMRLARRRGVLFLDMRLTCAARKNRHFSRKAKVHTLLARYKAGIPGYSDTPEMQLTASSLEQSHSRHSDFADSTISVTVRSLQSSQVFDIHRCHPVNLKLMGLPGHNEWKPSTARQWAMVWRSPWRDEHLVNWSGLLHCMSVEMKNDAIIFFQTLYSQNMRHAPFKPRLTPEEEEAHDLRVNFLKRLILCMAACKLTFCTEENGTAMRAWPFPLAAALSHGNRILIQLDGVPWQEFVNLLLFGDPKAHSWMGEKAVPYPFWARWAATHAIGLHHDNCRLYERKLTGVGSNTLKNVADGLLGHHLGLDLPLGGLGNRAPSTGPHGPLYVGPAGVPFRRLQSNNDDHPRYVEEIQHGHLYLRWDDFGVTTVPVLTADNGSSSCKNASSAAAAAAANAAAASTSSASSIMPLPRKVASASTAANAANASNSTTAGNTASSSGAGGPDSQELTALNSDGDMPSPQGPESVELPTGASRRSCTSQSEWMQMPDFRSLEDLQDVLTEHGYDAICRDRASFQRLYRMLVEDTELALQVDGFGRLRCRGVLMHLVVEHRDDDKTVSSRRSKTDEIEDKVLVHMHAEAMVESLEKNDDGWLATVGGGARAALGATMYGVHAAVGTVEQVAISGVQAANAGVERIDQGVRQLPHAFSMLWSGDDRPRQTQKPEHESQKDGGPQPAQPGETSEVLERNHRVEDVRVAVIVRKRHESWTDAMRRLCQRQLQLGSEALDTVINRCRMAMNGDTTIPSGDELCIYECEGAPSVCHHHGPDFLQLLPIEYQAYRFVLRLGKKDRTAFSHLMHTEFETVEHGMNLDGFGETLRRARGSIARTWSWVPLSEALRMNVAGLLPPEDRLHIIHETEPLSAVLVGIEGAAPHKENCFGRKHGIHGVSSDSSSFGTRKWRDYRKGGQEVPADIGGMRVNIDQRAFDDFTFLIQNLDLSKPSDGYKHDPRMRRERHLFRNLLMASDEEAEALLREHCQFGRPQLHYQTGTMVLDTNVRERSLSKNSANSTNTSGFNWASRTLSKGRSGKTDWELESDSGSEPEESPTSGRRRSSVSSERRRPSTSAERKAKQPPPKLPPERVSI